MKKFSLSALRFGRRKKTEAEALGGAAASTSKRSVVSDARAYEVIRKPVITEKATMISEHNQVTFVVATDASKPEIRAAVEKLFKVKVTAVNTMRREGKLKRVRGLPGRRNETKKAIVTLAEGYSIDVTTGL